MTALYLTSRLSDPHDVSADDPSLTHCGRSLQGAVEITELQAEVFLGGRRCPSCFPGFATSTLAMARRAT